MFSVEKMCEKYLRKGKDLYVTFTDMEKVYDKIDMDEVCQVLHIYDINGKLQGTVKRFFKESKVCVNVCREKGKSFPLNVGVTCTGICHVTVVAQHLHQ